MKILDKIALVLFSYIVLIISIVFGLIIFGWVSIDTINIGIKYILNTPTASNITLGILLALILLAIKGIFFSTSSKTESGMDNGILIQNENGKLFISRDTIQNLVKGVVIGVPGTQDVATNVILSRDNNISIDVTLFVNQDIVIKDLSNDLQIKIKEVVKKSMDVEIKEVNIKIKNIAPKQDNTVE